MALSHKQFSALPRVQQTLLMALAGIARPTARVHLAEALTRTGLWPEASAWAQKPQGMNIPLQELRAGGWIEEFRQGMWICAPEARELAARQAFQEGVLRKLMAISQSPYAQEGAFTRMLADLRLAFFERRADHLWSLHLRIQEVFSREMKERDPLCLLCGDPFEEGWFEALDPDLQRGAAWSLIKEQALLLRPNPAFSAWMARKALKPQSSQMFMAVCLFLLLEGRVSEARAWLKVQKGPHSTHPIHAALGALADLAEGRAGEAAKGFLAAITGLKRLSGKRIQLLPPPLDFFHILALLSLGEAASMRLAQERILVMERVHHHDCALEVPVHLKGLCESLGGALPNPPSRHYDPRGFGLVAAILCGYLSGAEVPVRYLDAFQKAAASTSLGWLRGAAEEIRRRSAGDRPRPHSLVDLIPRTEPWERALEALDRFTPSATPVAPVASKRLAWTLRPLEYAITHYDIKPLEQRLGAKGGWSKGRPVSLKKLREDTAEFEYLTPQDHRLISTVQVSRAWQGLSYEMDEALALPALIGHPHVYWEEDDESRPMELVAGKPELHLEEAGQHLSLKLSPRPTTPGALVVADGPNRRRVYVFSEEHHRLDKILGEGLTVPSEAKGRVVKSLGAVAPFVEVHAGAGFSEQEHLDSGMETRPGNPAPRLLLLPYQRGLKVQLRIRPLPQSPAYHPGQGGASLMLHLDGKRLLVTRDLSEERRRSDEALAALPCLDPLQEGEWLLDEPEDCLQLLLEAGNTGLELEWPEGQRFQTPRSLGPEAMRLKVASGKDWFSLDGEVRIDEGRVLELRTLLDLVDQAPGRFVPLGEGSFLALTQTFRRRLADLRAFGERQGKGLRLAPVAALALEGLEDGWGAFLSDKGWKAQQERIRTAMGLNPEVPAAFEAELRPYQEAGFHWMARLAEAGFGACLADDMGLGKTIQALALLIRRGAQGPALVVAPTSVCANWTAEALKFAPSLSLKNLAEGDREALLKDLGPMDVLLCSYGLLHSEAERLRTLEWSTVILDEAQAIKNAFTKRSQAAMSLKAGFRLILSGTPLENHLGELWNLFRFINPGLLGSLESFQRRFQTPIERDRDPEALQRLRRLTAPFLLRRTKAQVLQDLPGRTEITLELEPSPEETAFLEALRRKSLEDLGTKGSDQALQVLAAIMRLRRACCHPELVQPGIGLESSKQAAFLELVEELRENHHRALVFSQFVDHLAILRLALDARGIAYQYLDGSTPAKARQKAVTAFQSGQGELFLISLKAGGTGLNLTGADYVIHMDPWWNPAVEDQASDRAHRIGQTRPVTIYRLVIKGSIEQRIVALHQSKRQLADQLLEERASAARLDAKALMALLQGT